MTNIVFIAKTDLNTDGRILNQIKILEQSLPEIKIDFILMPDKPVKINPGKYVKIHTVNTLFRHNKFLRFFTTLEFVIKSLFLIFRLKPKVIHTQDTAVVLPVLIYRLIKGNSFNLIYDDHEIPNENEGLSHKMFNYFEVILMKKADHVIFANEERMVVLKEKHNLKNKCTYFLNLPYFEDKDEYEIDNKNKSKLIELDELITSGFKFIIHQGVLEYERGREKLAEFSRILPDNFKILLLGGSLQDYNTFIVEYKLDSSKFHFVGSVNYLVLPKFWERGIASIVMYLPTYINNRLCAPNRFYISVQKGLPVIVNKNNPVLSNFIVKYDSGFFIEDITADNFYNIESKKIEENLFSDLKKQQINEFLNVYDTLLQ